MVVVLVTVTVVKLLVTLSELELSVEALVTTSVCDADDDIVSVLD